jgi:hypothetical protein
MASGSVSSFVSEVQRDEHRLDVTEFSEAVSASNRKAVRTQE